MLKFVTSGKHSFVWINPLHVRSVTIVKKSAAITRIDFVGGGAVHVLEQVEKVVEAIEEKNGQ